MFKISIGTILNWFSPNDLLKAVLGKFGLSDVVGMLAHWAYDTYKANGREAVVALATIKTASLQSWATSVWSASGGDPSGSSAFVSNVISKFGALANAFADAVGSLIPASQSAPPASDR